LQEKKTNFWRNTIKNIKNKKKDFTFSAQYESTIHFIFDGVDEINPQNQNQGPFNNTIRIYLVHNILNNIRFLTKEEKVELLVVTKFKSIMNHTNTLSQRYNNKVNSEITDSTKNGAQSKKIRNKLRARQISNMHFENSITNAHKGLPYMLKENYFKE
jgi:hypothetical protein